VPLIKPGRRPALSLPFHSVSKILPKSN
jgi:hypothetical protein